MKNLIIGILVISILCACVPVFADINWGVEGTDFNGTPYTYGWGWCGFYDGRLVEVFVELYVDGAPPELIGQASDIQTDECYVTTSTYVYDYMYCFADCSAIVW